MRICSFNTGQTITHNVENGLVMGYADCKCFTGLVETSKVVSIVSLALCQTHCKQVPEFSHLSTVTHRKSVSKTCVIFMVDHNSFGYCFSGPLPLRSHKEQVTFSRPFLGVPSLLDYTRNRPDPS